MIIIPPEGSVATITTELSPKLACNGVPVNVVLSLLFVNVRKLGNVDDVISQIWLSSSVTVILYV